MTYGWAILIIAVVLAALFSLGVFGNQSSSNTPSCDPTKAPKCDTTNSLVPTNIIPSNVIVPRNLSWDASYSKQFDNLLFSVSMTHYANLIYNGHILTIPKCI